MEWYKKALEKNRREIISGAVFVVTSALALLVWHYFFGNTFVWKDISPLSPPIEYAFYSALVFIGPGRYLYYHTDFYKTLWRELRTKRKDYYLHRDIKKLVWITMVIIMLILVVIVFWFLNKTISLLYNLIRLTIFIFPPVGVGLACSVVSYALLKKDHIDGSKPISPKKY